MLERAWGITRNIGGALLVAEIVILLIGSAHYGHLLRNSREFGRAFDDVTEGVTSECKSAAHWIAARGR
jgi:hypothetical protein